MHKVHITKEEAVLWGTSNWNKFRKGSFAQAGKDQVRSAVRGVKQFVSGDKHDDEEETLPKADAMGGNSEPGP